MLGLSSFSPSPDPAGSTAGAVMAVQGGTQHAGKQATASS